MSTKMTTMKVSKETKEKFDDLYWSRSGDPYDVKLSKFLDGYTDMVKACAMYHELLTLDYCIADIPLPSSSNIEEKEKALKMAIYELEYETSLYPFFADLVNPLSPPREPSEYNKELIDRYNNELRELQSIKASYTIFNKEIPPSLRSIIYKHVSEIQSDRINHDKKWSDELKETRSIYMPIIPKNDINFKNEDDIETTMKSIVKEFRYRFLLYATERGRLTKENINYNYSINYPVENAELGSPVVYGVYNGVRVDIPIIAREFSFSTLGDGLQKINNTARGLADIENRFFAHYDDGVLFFEKPIDVALWVEDETMVCKVIWGANTIKTPVFSDAVVILRNSFPEKIEYGSDFKIIRN